jgi:hypothetical protein
MALDRKKDCYLLPHGTWKISRTSGLVFSFRRVSQFNAHELIFPNLLGPQGKEKSPDPTSTVESLRRAPIQKIRVRKSWKHKVRNYGEKNPP